MRQALRVKTKISLNSAPVAVKQNALQAVLRLRGRLNLWCAVDCAGGGLGAVLTPFSISAFPVRGCSIAEHVVGVNTLIQSPLIVAGRPSNAWECYNYQFATDWPRGPDDPAGQVRQKPVSWVHPGGMMSLQASL